MDHSPRSHPTPSPPVHEAERFAWYLIGRSADRQTRELYDKATKTRARSTNPRDTRILAFAEANPWSLASLDGALALTNPQAPLRQRLLLTAAILEARPTYCDAFFTKDRSPFYLLFIAFVLARAAARAAFGLLLLRFIR
jgi:hypothetical protein